MVNRERAVDYLNSLDKVNFYSSFSFQPLFTFLIPSFLVFIIENSLFLIKLHE